MSSLILILGSGRSGTTMLDLMLGNGDDAFSCGEVYAWFRPWRIHHHKIVCSCGDNSCPVWSDIKSFPENNFHAKVIRALNVDFMIDSSKDLCWGVDCQRWAKNNKLDLFNLVLWKDPIDLAYSHWKRNRGLESWKDEFVGYYGRLLGSGLPFYSVSFSELVADPSGKIAAICDVTGIRYFSGKEFFWQGRHHHLFGSLGTRKQVETGKGTIRKTVFRDDFKPYVNGLLEAISLDNEVQAILKKLKAQEVSKVILSGSARPHLFKESLLYPSWYYVGKLLRLYRRFFPQHWKLDRKV